MDHQRNRPGRAFPRRFIGRNQNLTSRREAIPADAARLLPVISRALDLGRGPPALMSWLRERLPRSRPHDPNPSSAERASMLNRLAIEAAELLNRPANGTVVSHGSWHTLATGVFDTLSFTSGGRAPDRPTVVVDATNAARDSVAQPVAETILVAEDEPAVRNLVRYVLRQGGYAVIEAGSGPEALALAEKHAGIIDLLITDVMMPHMGGDRLAELLRARRPGLKVLFLSGYPDESVAHCVPQDQSAFLQKPFSPHALAEMVRGIINR
jgi:CheY-like chemotaxis protein